MNLKEHFDSYRTSVLRDSLEDATWYAQQRATRSSDYPTAYDYTTYALNLIKNAIVADDEPAYRCWLTQHQKAMIAIFEAMVEEELWGYSGITGEDLLRLINTKGLRWFKFSKCAVALTLNAGAAGVYPMIWIPRYSEAFAQHWREQQDSLVFDADELPLLLSKGREALQRRPIPAANGEAVRDWSLTLFGGA